MAPLKYNPLLKRNLQEINDEPPFDPSEIESEIADLQQKKVTKFFSATDTLQSGEIAQYQGENDNINNLVKGYFYTKSETSIVIPTNSPYFKYSTYQPTIIANGYVFRPGDYFAYEKITPANTSNFYNFSLVYYEGYSNYLFINTSRTVGESVWNKTNHNVVTVTATAPGTITLSDDTIINYSNYTSAPFLNIYNCYSVDCSPYSIITTNMQDIVVHYTLNDDVFNLTDFFSVPVSQFVTSSDISLYNSYFFRVDTQPQPATATTTAAGLMSAADKSKLNGIDTGANKYTLPTATSSKLGGIKVGANLAISNGVLSGNYSNATTENDGLMSAEDKTKINTIGVFYRGLLQHNLLVMKSGDNLIHLHCQDFETDSCCLDCYIAARGTLGSSESFTWHYCFVIFDQTKLGIACNFNGLINIINNTGRPDTDFILFIDKLI